MTQVLAAPEDVCNAALAQLGVKRRVGSLYDGTEISRALLDIYGQTRDALLRASDWDFAESIAPGVIAGVAPLPFGYQYAYPADAVRIRSLFPAGYDSKNPVPVNFRLGLAVVNATLSQVIWTNVQNATLVYTKQVTNTLLWSASFTESMIGRLVRSIALAAAGVEVLKLFLEAESAETAADAMVEG